MIPLFWALLGAIPSLASSGWEQRQATPLRGELAFQDSDLDDFLAANPKAAIYAWSPHVPRSVDAIAPFLAAAKALDLPARVLLDPQADEALARRTLAERQFPADWAKRLRSLALIQRGALLEYPTVVLFKGGKPLADTIGGDRAAGYQSLLARKLADHAAARPGPLPEARPAPVTVLGITALPANDYSYGVGPLPGTRWVSVQDGAGAGLLLNLADGRATDTLTGEVLGTVAGAPYSYYSAGAGGLALAETSDFLRRAGNPAPARFYLDADFPARDATVGLLFTSQARTQLRFLSDSAGVAPRVRDYTVQNRRGDAPPKVTGLSRPGPACQNFAAAGFGRTALSADGRLLFTNPDFPARSAAVYELNPRDSSACTLSFPLGLPTSRASFSADGTRIAFTAAGGDAYVYELKTRQLLRLDGLDAILGYGTPLPPQFGAGGALLLPYLKDGGGLLLVELEL